MQHVSILANRERLGHCEFGKGVLLSLSPRQQAFRRTILYFAVWMTYVAGGVRHFCRQRHQAASAQKASHWSGSL